MTPPKKQPSLSVPDLTAERIQALRGLLPEAFSEGRIDFEKLRAALGEILDDSPERYAFSWAGKRDALRLLQTPTRATLVPCPEESLSLRAPIGAKQSPHSQETAASGKEAIPSSTGDRRAGEAPARDDMQSNNIFIEGDNLEALKLLYKPYFGRIKMIYIDPPYNTGNDFIYPDDYSDPLGRYLELTGQQDTEGNLLTSNPETSGRYHSAWLSMMYPRLFLARQLLREDGVIFVSIDDHEVHNLRLLMNEIFGEENFVATFVRRRRMATGMRGEPVSPDHEYVIAFARSSSDIRLFGTASEESDFIYEDTKGKYRSTDLTVGMTKDMRPNQYYPITYPQTKEQYWPPENRVWRFQPSTMSNHIDDDNIIWPSSLSERNLTRPRFKNCLIQKRKIQFQLGWIISRKKLQIVCS